MAFILPTIKYCKDNEKTVAMKFLTVQPAYLCWKLYASLRLTLAVLLISFFTACGGGNSASDTVSDPTTPVTVVPGTPNQVTGITSPIEVVPLIITPGAYVSELNDWVLILIRSQLGSGATSKFFGLNYETSDPDIYSGSGLIAGTESATLTNVMFFQNMFTTVRIGTVTVNKTKASNLIADFSFPAKGSIEALNPTNYQYNSAPTLTSVQGTWQGRLSYGVGSSGDFTLVISNKGTVSTSLTFQQDCRITQSTLVPNFDGTNLFAWNLTIPNATLCSFKNQTLTGAAFVTASPVAGKTQRLYAVAISPDGRGVSFKADR
jgi:hypothetical protein